MALSALQNVRTAISVAKLFQLCIVACKTKLFWAHSPCTRTVLRLREMISLCVAWSYENSRTCGRFLDAHWCLILAMDSSDNRPAACSASKNLLAVMQIINSISDSIFAWYGGSREMGKVDCGVSERVALRSDVGVSSSGRSDSKSVVCLRSAICSMSR